ncbi:DUF1255 family protein, partial [Bacillus subtilis]|nr:DUF1255 family protein [Bacillus subtilis]
MTKVHDNFDGTVKSIAFDMTADPATLGLMSAGENRVGTRQPEIKPVEASWTTVQTPASGNEPGNTSI